MRRSLRTRVHCTTWQLLGTNGLAFLRLAYPEQSERTASPLRLVDEDEPGESIAELAGSELLAALNLAHQRYEDMVAARASRGPRPSEDFGDLRAKLQRAIACYSTAVLTMLDEDEPDSREVVLTALRPIEVARARFGSAKRGGQTRDAPPTPVADSAVTPPSNA